MSAEQVESIMKYGTRAVSKRSPLQLLPEKMALWEELTAPSSSK